MVLDLIVGVCKKKQRFSQTYGVKVRQLFFPPLLCDAPNLEKKQDHLYHQSPYRHFALSYM